ncbi:hypothetical protein I3842_15G074500 [Carya illinoinensis]|uniref:Uncharacterized protein n=1 Tax=Carya illinoinensis TaxID=32201 RepID=A0A922D7V9_CARIL|nr:hypothetical protein I3842_15G074500 [Carya illinoinensis]
MQIENETGSVASISPMIYFRLEQWKRILNDYTSAGNSERPWIFCVFISDDIFSFGDSKENLERLIIG